MRSSRASPSARPRSSASRSRAAVAPGFQYGLGFDRGALEGDHELEQHGVRIVVDPFSAPYLTGATIDWLDGLQESGFKIDNPQATASCGCGHSFQVDEGESPESSARRGLRLRLRLAGSVHCASPWSAPGRPGSTPRARC